VAGGAPARRRAARPVGAGAVPGRLGGARGGRGGRAGAGHRRRDQSRLGVPVRSVDPDDAAAHFGWIGLFFAADAPASSVLTRQALDWTPTGPGLIDDLDAGSYFRS
jgi:hypothetical protein